MENVTHFYANGVTFSSFQKEFETHSVLCKLKVLSKHSAYDNYSRLLSCCYTLNGLEEVAQGIITLPGDKNNEIRHLSDTVLFRQCSRQKRNTAKAPEYFPFRTYAVGAGLFQIVYRSYRGALYSF